MRVSHLDLEAAQRDVLAFLRAKAAPPTGRRRGYNQILKQAIYTYHRQNGDDNAARVYLRNHIARADLHNPTRVYRAELDLDSYVAWCQHTGVIVTDHRLRISLPLTDDVLLGGEVGRADYLGESSYRGVLLVSALAPDWDRELRMPLLQRAVALALERNEADVSIALQGLGGGQIVERSFSTAEIERSMTAARRVARAIARGL